MGCRRGGRWPGEVPRVEVVAPLYVFDSSRGGVPAVRQRVVLGAVLSEGLRRDEEVPTTSNEIVD